MNIRMAAHTGSFGFDISSGLGPSPGFDMAALLFVAVLTLSGGVGPFKWPVRFIVMKRQTRKTREIVPSSLVVAMTLDACALNSSVIALVSLDSLRDFLMAVQAFLVGNAFGRGMTFRAFAQTLKLGMGFGQGSGIQHSPKVELGEGQTRQKRNR